MPEQPKIQFTPAQAAAIRARGGSLLVSAAAGSGKTRVLVERVVGLITDPEHPADADSLLIMTFTNAAAAKLRADITARLAQEVRAHPGNTNLRRQQLLLQRASIGTVDAFCLHFVQQHFAMLDVPPDFTTAEEADLARIEQETLAATLETAYQDADFRAFADLYDRGRTDSTAGDAVLDLYHFTRALPHPAASLTAFAEMWQQEAPPQQTEWGRELLGIALARAQGVKALLDSGAAIAARDEKADAAYTAVMLDDAARVENLCYHLEQGDWDKCLSALELVLSGWRAAGRIKGGKDAARVFIDNLHLFSLLANVADAKSLVIHPASTTHSQETLEELEDQGIHQGTIRLSIGLENIDDIIEDLESGFKALRESGLAK